MGSIKLERSILVGSTMAWNAFNMESRQDTFTYWCLPASSQQRALACLLASSSAASVIIMSSGRVLVLRYPLELTLLPLRIVPGAQ